MLQNCHLGLRFMGEIEQTMVKLEEIHADFQLWITAEPHVKFPIGLLQTSIKITNEAPAGVRAGLKSSTHSSIRYARCDLPSRVEDPTLWSLLPSYNRAGEAEIWAAWLQYPV